MKSFPAVAVVSGILSWMDIDSKIESESVALRGVAINVTKRSKRVK